MSGAGLRSFEGSFAAALFVVPPLATPTECTCGQTNGEVVRILLALTCLRRAFPRRFSGANAFPSLDPAR